MLSFCLLPNTKLSKDVVPGVPVYLTYEKFVTHLLGLHYLDREFRCVVILATDKIAQMHIYVFSRFLSWGMTMRYHGDCIATLDFSELLVQKVG